jgi:hypothetical protein
MIFLQRRPIDPNNRWGALITPMIRLACVHSCFRRHRHKIVGPHAWQYVGIFLRAAGSELLSSWRAGRVVPANPTFGEEIRRRKTPFLFQSRNLLTAREVPEASSLVPTLLRLCALAPPMEFTATGDARCVGMFGVSVEGSFA